MPRINWGSPVNITLLDSNMSIDVRYSLQVRDGKLVILVSEDFNKDPVVMDIVTGEVGQLFISRSRPRELKAVFAGSEHKLSPTVTEKIRLFCLGPRRLA